MSIIPDPNLNAAAPMGGAPPAQAPVASAPVASNVPDYRKLALATALMGGGGGQGASQSFAGGLAQGMGPILQHMMMQKMMAGMNGGGPGAAVPGYTDAMGGQIPGIVATPQ